MAHPLISIIFMPINYHLFLVPHAEVVSINFKWLLNNEVIFTTTLPNGLECFVCILLLSEKNISLWKQFVATYIRIYREQLHNTILVYMVISLCVQIIIEKPYTCYFCRFTKYGRNVVEYSYQWENVFCLWLYIIYTA